MKKVLLGMLLIGVSLLAADLDQSDTDKFHGECLVHDFEMQKYALPLILESYKKHEKFGNSNSIGEYINALIFVKDLNIHILNTHKKMLPPKVVSELEGYLELIIPFIPELKEEKLRIEGNMKAY